LWRSIGLFGYEVLDRRFAPANELPPFVIASLRNEGVAIQLTSD
jgi:hypothetical protein